MNSIDKKKNTSKMLTLPIILTLFFSAGSLGRFENCKSFMFSLSTTFLRNLLQVEKHMLSVQTPEVSAVKRRQSEKYQLAMHSTFDETAKTRHLMD